MSTTKAPTVAALRAAQEILDAMWRAHRDGQPVHSALAIAAIIDAEIAPLVEALRCILSNHDCLTENRTCVCGSNDSGQHNLACRRVSIARETARAAIAKATGGKP